MIRMAQISLLIILFLMGFAMSGCADDMYGECSISPDPGDTLERCLGDDGSSQKSCVVAGEIECQTGACARYRSSDFFCTSSCESDGDCPSGVCREFTLHQGTYCVADQFLPSDE